MKHTKKIISVLLLGAVVCAPQAQAMQQVARFARTAVNTAVKANNALVIAQSAKSVLPHQASLTLRREVATRVIVPSMRNTISVPKINNYGLNSAMHPALNGRSLSSTAVQRAAITAQQSVGIRAMSNAINHQSIDGSHSVLPEDLIKETAEKWHFMLRCEESKLMDIIKTYPTIKEHIAASLTKNGGPTNFDLGSMYSEYMNITYKMADMLLEDNNDKIMTLFAGMVEDNIIKYVEQEGEESRFRFCMHVAWKLPNCRVLAKKFTPYAVANLGSLTQSRSGSYFLDYVMEHNPEASKQFTPHAVAHIEWLVKDWNGVDFLECLMRHNPEVALKFASRIIANPTVFVARQEGITFVSAIMRKHEAARISLMQQCAETLWEHAPELILPWRDTPYGKEAIAKIVSRGVLDKKKPYTFSTMLVKSMVSSNPTLTQKYLVITYKDMHSGSKTDLKDPKVVDMVDETIAIEQSWLKDHYIFEHGRRWTYKLPEMVYRHFYQLANNIILPDDFMFTHTKPHIYSHRLKAQEFEQEKALHTQVINERENIPGEVRNRRLFMNTGLLGNVNSEGSSSLYYVLKNYNQADARISMRSIFEQFGLQALYEKHKAQCEALEQEAQALSKWGQLLVIGIPKDKISELATYLCISGRPKPAINVGGQETYDAKRILDARLEDPELANNKINWVAAMTDCALLDPRSGVKIKAIDRPINLAAFKAWEMKFNEFMQSIRAEAKEIMDAHKRVIEKNSQNKWGNWRLCHE